MMKLILYNRILDFTSFLVNLTIKMEWWSLTMKLINFRKKHIVLGLRKGVIKFR